MSPTKIETFETNPNKDFLRDSYDRELIKIWYAKKGRSLKYLGLPAWQMLDILSWEKFLSRFTAIEREENQQHLMFLKANVNDVEHRLDSLYGEFDNILLTGRDRYGNTPAWPYDLVNLDYFGGLIYPNLSRPKALRKLVQNQAAYETSFFMIVTQHLRDRDTAGEKQLFLEELRMMLKSGIHDKSLHPGVDKVIDWYLGTQVPDAVRQALYMNFLLKDIGEIEHFDVKCRAPIIYAGTGGSWMMHFATDFVIKPSVGHRVASEQTLVEVINLGLREIKDGAFAQSRFVQPLVM